MHLARTQKKKNYIINSSEAPTCLSSQPVTTPKVTIASPSHSTDYFNQFCTFYKRNHTVSILLCLASLLNFMSEAFIHMCVDTCHAFITVQNSTE